MNPEPPNTVATLRVAMGVDPLHAFGAGFCHCPGSNASPLATRRRPRTIRPPTTSGRLAMTAILHALSSTDAEQEEWRLRCDMAAVFRVAARLGWNEQIGNHNSLMLPQEGGAPPLFLINPRGYLFQELTASSLIVCDLDGR